MADYSELKRKAQEIKDEVKAGANTANRVGLALEETVKALEAENQRAEQAEVSLENSVQLLQDETEDLPSIRENLETLVVNDLTTGGADKALSAEMGKDLNVNYIEAKSMLGLNLYSKTVIIENHYIDSTNGQTGGYAKTYDCTNKISVPGGDICIGGFDGGITIFEYTVEGELVRIYPTRSTTEGITLTLDATTRFLALNFHKFQYSDDSYRNSWLFSKESRLYKVVESKVQDVESKVQDVESKVQDVESKVQDVESKTTLTIKPPYLEKNNALSVNIKQGEKFYFINESTNSWSRFILYYNGENLDRLLDTRDVSIIGTKIEFVAPVDIFSFGVYIATNVETDVSITIVRKGELSQLSEKVGQLSEAVERLSLGNTDISIDVNDKELIFNSGDFRIEASFDIYPDRPHFYNPIFNFRKYAHTSGWNKTVSDDVAPTHVINTTIGANHGQPCYNATIASHGLDNTAIGKPCVSSDGTIYYIVLIVDTDNIWLLSKNYGTTISPNFKALSAGDLIFDNRTTLTVSSVARTQMWPSAQNVKHKILINGTDEVVDGFYTGKYIDILEEYEVSDPVSVLENLISRAGEDSDPSFTGDALLRIQTIYRFVKGCSVIIFQTITPMREMAFSDFMFAQSELATKFKYYIPNSKPINNYDFRKPLEVQWSSSVPILNIGAANIEDPDNPVNRIVTYGEHLGFAIGFLPYAGVGKNLKDYTKTTFEIRNNTGKIYPHGVDKYAVGETLQPYQSYNAVMYRALIDKSTDAGNRMSMYRIPCDNKEYIYIDYRGDTVDRIELDSSYNGKAISVVDSVNTKLLSDVYNDGISVLAKYNDEQTCYIVISIDI